MISLNGRPLSLLQLTLRCAGDQQRVAIYGCLFPSKLTNSTVVREDMRGLGSSTLVLLKLAE